MSGLVFLIIIYILIAHTIKKNRDEKKENRGFEPAKRENAVPLSKSVSSKPKNKAVSSEPKAAGGEKGNSDMTRSLTSTRDALIAMMEDRENDWLAREMREEQRCSNDVISEMTMLKLKHLKEHDSIHGIS